jgi:hypothetical protein
VRKAYGFVATGRVCEVDFLATKDLDAIEREDLSDGSCDITVPEY